MAQPNPFENTNSGPSAPAPDAPVVEKSCPSAGGCGCRKSSKFSRALLFAPVVLLLLGVGAVSAVPGVAEMVSPVLSLIDPSFGKLSAQESPKCCGSGGASATTVAATEPTCCSQAAAATPSCCSTASKAALLTSLPTEDSPVDLVDADASAEPPCCAEAGECPFAQASEEATVGDDTATDDDSSIEKKGKKKKKKGKKKDDDNAVEVE